MKDRTQNTETKPAKASARSQRSEHRSIYVFRSSSGGRWSWESTASCRQNVTSGMAPGGSANSAHANAPSERSRLTANSRVRRAVCMGRTRWALRARLRGPRQSARGRHRDKCRSWPLRRDDFRFRFSNVHTIQSNRLYSRSGGCFTFTVWTVWLIR